MDTPVYQRIAEGIAARIRSGELRPGDRVASTRQLMAEHGVAMATATRVLAHLREEGLVRAKPGVGTVVASDGRPPDAGPDTDRVVRAAVFIADVEGLSGLTMRRLAGELRIPTMSVYRHVADKEELLLLMMDRVMAANPPPSRLTPERDGWRACVEAIARLQWSMYRRHVWLAQAVSFTRPLLAPHAMAHTEYTMRALESCGLGPGMQFRVAVSVANYVRGIAVNLEDEAQAEQESGMTDADWMESQGERFAAAFATGRLPLMAQFMATGDLDFGLDRMLDFGLARLLDGIESTLDK